MERIIGGPKAGVISTQESPVKDESFSRSSLTSSPMEAKVKMKVRLVTVQTITTTMTTMEVAEQGIKRCPMLRSQLRTGALPDGDSRAGAHNNGVKVAKSEDGQIGVRRSVGGRPAVRELPRSDSSAVLCSLSQL
jgi:hypothetical protein